MLINKKILEWFLLKLCASFSSRPVSRLICWVDNQVIYNKRILIKGYSVPQDFSWIEDYKLKRFNCWRCILYTISRTETILSFKHSATFRHFLLQPKHPFTFFVDWEGHFPFKNHIEAEKVMSVVYYLHLHHHINNNYMFNCDTRKLNYNISDLLWLRKYLLW